MSIETKHDLPVTFTIGGYNLPGKLAGDTLTLPASHVPSDCNIIVGATGKHPDGRSFTVTECKHTGESVVLKISGPPASVTAAKAEERLATKAEEKPDRK